VLAKIPAALVGFVRDGSFDYYGNNFASYSMRGVHMQMKVRWHLKHFSFAPLRFSLFSPALKINPWRSTA
jgi:hypothetical protein